MKKRQKNELESDGGEKETRDEALCLCPYSLEFLGDTGGRIGIINYDLLQWQRLR